MARAGVRSAMAGRVVCRPLPTGVHTKARWTPQGLSVWREPGRRRRALGGKLIVPAIVTRLVTGCCVIQGCILREKRFQCELHDWQTNRPTGNVKRVKSLRYVQSFQSITK
jgi:hypothetical protein